jgi:hypothetical protein
MKPLAVALRSPPSTTWSDVPRVAQLARIFTPLMRRFYRLVDLIDTDLGRRP